MSHYTAIVIISSFSILGALIGIRGNRFMEPKRKFWFQILFSFLIIVNLAEWGAVYLDGNPSKIALRVAFKFVELSLTPIVNFASFMTVGKSYHRRVCVCLCVANLVLQIVSLFNGCVFYIDSNCVYHRNNWYIVYNIVVLTITVFWVISNINYVKQFQLKNVSMLIFILAVELIAFISQLIWSYLRMDWSIASFGALLYYIYLDMIEQQNDSLTRLLNRRYYEVHSAKITPGTTVVFFDIDSFKEINDTYGHNAGDDCLRSVGKEIKKVFAEVGYCYRYGGDEFCVILTKPYEDLDDLLRRFFKNISNSNFYGDIPLPTVSYGFSTLQKEESYEQMLERADKMMYNYKKLRKQNLHKEN